MYPTPYQWALLETYKQYPYPFLLSSFCKFMMSVLQTVSGYLRLSVSSVEHFFCDHTASGYRECAEKHCRKLTEIHVVWKMLTA
jgi:hypothetical protein